MEERLQLPPRLVIASHNPGKVREIDDLLQPFAVEVVGAASLNLPEPEETGDSFTANALLKAQAAAEGSGLPALSDDSGLSVWGLGGAPGIYSARWGGPDKDFAMAMKRVETELADNPDRSASFFCVLALAWPDGASRIFEGRVDGSLVFPPRGSNGFGYDPIFIPDGDTRTFGEMEMAEKKTFNHRARGFARLIGAADFH
ncbi:MAG: non-canonical purine NTP pyrophosphatase, RdgB/HAM1 family [Rhodospirillaceae bacterium]|nr:non-canonical purine NTP pyrophosphatase, RdgB/HAM1 family [Rhodospirillaceae bacterium]|tara:strand:+ start:2150 stop:2752 length:603 start_codon:yes stop_codon:yes gene_type:complete